LLREELDDNDSNPQAPGGPIKTSYESSTSLRREPGEIERSQPSSGMKPNKS
jgi:hypothetical protein